MDDFTKYEKMKAAGSSPEDQYREATTDGIDPITRIRMIRTVCALSPRQAKEVVVRAECQAASLSQYQGEIADHLRLLADPEGVRS